MTTHAIAMVKWNVFRGGGGGERYTRSYYYASKQKRLVNLVGDGGTLWLVTSRRKRGEERRYHLAYKLVDCVAAPPWEEKAEQFGPYMVRAQDWDSSVHFPYNDATDTLLRLRFTSGQPLTDRSKIGLRLLSIPQLTPDDIALMEAFQQKVLSERTVFLSYSHRNRRVATRLEAELEARNVHVYRDVTSLQPGEHWQASLERAVRSADCVVVLVSPAAAASDWVRREVNWATAELEAGGLVGRIVPLLLPSGGWDDFPELHPFHQVDYPRRPDAAFFDRLAAELVSIPRRRR
ncbi:MAG: toll/interleukin-1 receptor domain-containing protein [Anaerolineae bacterium]|nr:toll/interleukin-1 receptor domain-containing protein [Anaerolineae bacterium]